jgi:Flp pilus assembly protein TadD
MHWKKVFTLILITMPLLLSTGCQSRFISGVRKLMFRPQRSADQQMKDFYAQNVSPRVEVRAAVAAHERQDNEKMITPELAAHYRELAVLSPYDSMVRYNLGRLYLQEGALEPATYEFDMAASLDPQFTLAYLMLGRVLRLRGQYDLALAKLAVASRLQPEFADPYIEAGICWDQRGFPEKARQQYLLALAVAPNNLDAYVNLGYSFFLEGDYEGAIKQYKKALELSPDDPYANNNIAMAYGLKGDFKRAFAHFSRALGPSAAHNNVGFLWLQARQFTKSIEHFQEAVRLDPSSEPALTNLIAALRIVGRYEEAERAHQQLLMVQKRRQSQVGASTSQLQLDPWSQPDEINSMTRPRYVKDHNHFAARSVLTATTTVGAGLDSSINWKVLLAVMTLIQNIAVI